MSKELELKEKIISHIRFSVVQYEIIEDKEKKLAENFADAIQNVINLLRPTDGQESNLPIKKEFNYSYKTFLFAEDAINRASIYTSQKIEFWKKLLNHVLGLSYQDIELIYIILLKYAQEFDQAYKEHRRAVNLRTDTIMLSFQRILAESKQTFLSLKHEAETEFSDDLDEIRKNKKKGRKESI
jgi:hypothetical protein